MKRLFEQLMSKRGAEGAGAEENNEKVQQFVQRK